MLTLLALVVVALPLHAKDKPAHERGVLMQMYSSSRGNAEKDNKTLAGEILPTDSQHKRAPQVLCQEYTLQTERVTYKIGPKDAQHPALLAIRQTAEFRLHKHKLLRMVESEDKEREYVVISMTPRREAAQNQSASANRVCWPSGFNPG